MRNHLMRWSLVLVMAAGSVYLLRAGDGLKSGPQPGDFIPGSFQPFNVNGKFGKTVVNGQDVEGRHHCLVCEYGLKPVALVFAREPKDDALLMKLLKQIDALVEKDADSTFRTFVVFLSKWGRDTVIEAGLPEEQRTIKTEDLIELSVERKKFVKRLNERAKELDNMVVAYYPEMGPKGYKIDDEAEITLLLYDDFKVEKNFTFPAAQMTERDVEDIMKEVRSFVGRLKSK